MAEPRAGDRPVAHRIQIPPTAQMQLSAGLNWLDVVSRGRLGEDLIAAVCYHRRDRHTEPAVLIAAAVQYLVSGSDREGDRVNRYWHIADQISARERARYLNVGESELL